MNLAIIGSRGYPYIYSGYETFIKELSERLVKKNIKVTVYCHKSLFVDRPTKLNNIDLVYIPTIETKSLSQIIHSFFSIIHCCFKKPDAILVVNAANGPLGIIPKVFGIPTLINVDGLEWLRPKWKGLGSVYFKFAAKMATIFFDTIINDSEEMQKVYLKLFNKESKVIAYGAPKININQNSSLINNYGIVKNEYYLVIGRLIPDNNADLIIDGFLNSDSKKKLVIVGDVPYNDKYASKIKSLNYPNIVLCGYVKDSKILYQLYKNSYAYIHGHEFGGTNPTLINALYFGTAILALDTPFNREMLQNGEFGLLFQKNSDSIKNLIIYSEKNLDKVKLLRRKSPNGITKKYNWDYITNQYIFEFKSLISKN
tara:strand:+ start:4826 stop:5935 length:1110 start_codon:yes stop_codon:yes gene_type:complete